MNVPKIYAGCDVDEHVKLYLTDDGMNSRPLRLSEWIPILDSLGCQMGEMPLVHLYRDPKNKNQYPLSQVDCRP